MTAAAIGRSLATLGMLGALVAACSVGSSPTPAATSTSAVPSAEPGAECPTSQPDPLPAGEERVVSIETAEGTIEITVEADLSPIAAGNFVALASCGYYDGVVFHRTAGLQDGTPFVIQGGDPTGTGTGGP